MAMVYDVDQTRPLTLRSVHDPDEKVYYTLRYRPPVWANGIEVKAANVDGDIGEVVRPSMANGFIAECISNGLTGANEPTWGSVEDAEVIDGSVLWKMIPDDFMLEDGDTISQSTWSASDSVTIDNQTLSGYDTAVRVTAVPDGVLSFVLTNVIQVTRKNGRLEEFNRSIKIKVKTL